MTSDDTPPGCPPPDFHPRKPRYAVPAGMVDCHCHLFDRFDRYPLAPGRSYTPARATLEDYLAMCTAVGVARTVQVNASTFGFDNTITLDAIAALGQRRARGVCGIPHDAPTAEIERLHAGGIRGVRLSTRVRGYGGIALLEPLAARVFPLGWHVQLHVADIAELSEIEAQLMRCPSAIVFDHLGCARGDDGVDAPGFQTLLRVLRARDDCWVKISSWYRRTRAGPPAYEDMRPLAQALVAARPDRCVWGSNWPHPQWHGPMPNDGDLVDVFCGWVPDPSVRQRILVDNPARLYGFE